MNPEGHSDTQYIIFNFFFHFVYNKYGYTLVSSLSNCITYSQMAKIITKNVKRIFGVDRVFSTCVCVSLVWMAHHYSLSKAIRVLPTL
jgi:hypothetical protein